jgi:hypothetical protein
MNNKLLNRFLDLEEGETGGVVLLLIMSFFMGAFLATYSVAAQTLFLNHFSEPSDLPKAFMISGFFGLLATLGYNFLQSRIPFRVLALLSLLTITVITGFIEFGKGYFEDDQLIFFLGYTQLAPFTLIILLVFWGAFNRLFNVRQSKRLLGTVDQGALIASLISFFTIPFVLGILEKSMGSSEKAVESLYTISLISIIVFTVLFYVLSTYFSNERWSLKRERELNHKLSIAGFFRNKYVLFLSLFV